MSKKIAVAIVHGVGTQGSRFADPMIEELTDRFADHTGLDVAAARADSGPCSRGHGPNRARAR